MPSLRSVSIRFVAYRYVSLCFVMFRYVSLHLRAIAAVSSIDGCRVCGNR